MSEVPLDSRRHMQALDVVGLLLQGVIFSVHLTHKSMGGARAHLARAAWKESSPPMTSPPPMSRVMSGEASLSLAASRLAAFFSMSTSL